MDSALTMEERLSVSLRAKVGLVWIRTSEEVRVERIVTEIADELGYDVELWSVTQGFTRAGSTSGSRADTRDLSTALQAVLTDQGRKTYVIRDAFVYFNDPVSLRTAKDLHRILPTLPKENAKQVLFLDMKEPPEGLTGVTVIDWPLPDRETVGAIVDSFAEWAPDDASKKLDDDDNRRKIVDAALGLPAEEIGASLARSLAATGSFDASLVSSDKEHIVRGSGLEWYQHDPRGLEGVGGLESLKDWLMCRRQAFTDAAQAYGLPSPKGVLLLGIPGCGKSLTAKCVAAAWGLPLLRMDVGSLFSKWVGQSESQLRTALQTAETVAPCILWLDEIEKAFSVGQGDAGTSQRVFGTFLTWLQERKGGVFVFATANDISQLPPEFLRAGRWDDIWFVDLPSRIERVAITRVLLAKQKACARVKAEPIAKASDGYTGAELEAAISEAMYTAFADNGRPVKTADVTLALKSRVPLSSSLKERIDASRAWARNRARYASPQSKSSPVEVVVTTADGSRAIE